MWGAQVPTQSWLAKASDSTHSCSSMTPTANWSSQFDSAPLWSTDFFTHQHHGGRQRGLWSQTDLGPLKHSSHRLSLLLLFSPFDSHSHPNQWTGNIIPTL